VSWARSLLHAKSELPSDALHAAATTLLDVVLRTSHDPECQARVFLFFYFYGKFPK
jgi:hypothetical protein